MEIEGLRVLGKDAAPKAIKAALAWAAQHTSVLQQVWNEQNERNQTMTSKVRITSVTPVAGQQALQLEFSNRRKLTVDLAGYIHSFKVLKPLEDPELFGQARVGDWGFDVCWSDDIELAATTLYRLGLEQAGEVMPVEAFKRWMADNQLSLTTAATALGFTRRTITAYSSGSALIPKYVALACKGWEAENKPESSPHMR